MNMVLSINLDLILSLTLNPTSYIIKLSRSHDFNIFRIDMHLNQDLMKQMNA